MESNNNSQEVVTIKINYPEGFSGKRHLKEGSTHEMALNSAELLVRKGIATILDFSVEEVIEGEANEEVLDEVITEEVVATDNVIDTPQVDAPLEALEVDSKKAKKSASKTGK